MPIQHPAAQEERNHLTESRAIIARERAVAVQERKNAEGELSTARMYDPDALPLREMLYYSAVQTVRNMDLADQKPYFTRVDFTEKTGEQRVYYIGKYGVLRTDTLEVAIVDWRAPVANLYYSGQIGPLRYTAPDGVVEGELTLKRQLGVENGELQSIFDTDVVSQDAYLQSVLGAMSSDRLREIVTTIQAEQNFVIRHPLNRSLVVQGVAGSGKTTIALHRIAYLLYTFQDALKPEHMVILAPNPLFLHFIAGVLPDLGVERVWQTTFSRLLAEWLGPALPKFDDRDRTETVASLPPAALDQLSRVARFKGSVEMDARIERWFHGFEARFSPEAGVKFGPVTLYTREQLDQFLLVDEKPFPMARRLAEFQKQLKAATKSAAKTILKWMTEEYDRRNAKLRATIHDPVALQEKLDRLRESRDARIKQVNAQVAPFVKETMASFPSLEPLALYKSFWREAAAEGGEAQLAAEHTLKWLEENKTLALEDAAPLAMLMLRIAEIKRRDIRHIVVDEAQDFSPLEFLLLKRLAPGATFTVVGDLMQGVRAWRGLTDWRDLTQGVFGGAAVTHHLVTSYRNTVEIMEAALRVARNRPVPGQKEAKPVLRHGEAPEFCPFANRKEQIAAIAQRVTAWRAEGMSTVAIVERSPEGCKSLLKALPGELGARILDVDAETYEGGLLIAPASAVKGLEFDAVLLADVSETSYADRELDARLLYVCLTRALHKLACLYQGAPTPLLR